MIEPELKENLKTVQKILSEEKSECFLVGGVLRDLLLERRTRDVDFAVKKNAKIGRAHV